MKKVALSEVKDDLSRYLRLAEKEEVIITRHGKPASLLIGFHSKTIGSTIDWRTTRVFLRESSPPGGACEPVRV